MENRKLSKKRKHIVRRHSRKNKRLWTCCSCQFCGLPGCLGAETMAGNTSGDARCLIDHFLRCGCGYPWEGVPLWIMRHFEVPLRSSRLPRARVIGLIPFLLALALGIIGSGAATSLYLSSIPVMILVKYLLLFLPMNFSNVLLCFWLVPPSPR